MKMLSRKRPRPSMEILTSWSIRTSVKRVEVNWDPWTLSCLSRGIWARERSEDLSSHVAFETSDDLAFGKALCQSSGDIVFGALIGAHPTDDHHVQGRVGLTVPTPVQSVPGGLAAGGRQGCRPAEHGKPGLRGEPLRVVSRRHQELAGILDAHPLQGKQFGAELGHQRLDGAVEIRDLVVQVEDAPGQRFEGDLGGDCWVTKRDRVRPPGGTGADELHACHVPHEIPDLLRSGDHGVVQLLQGSPPDRTAVLRVVRSTRSDSTAPERSLATLTR